MDDFPMQNITIYHKNSENKWDRYVKLKEEENKAAEKDKRQAIVIARSNFRGAAFQIMICQLYAISTEKTEE